MSHARETANRPEENGKDAKEDQAKTRDGERGKDGKSNGKNAGGGGGDDGFAAKRKDTAKKSVGRAMSRYAVWMNMHPMYSQPVILP